MEWVRRLSVELLKESPSPALRSCWDLANIYNPLARFEVMWFLPFLTATTTTVITSPLQGLDM